MRKLDLKFSVILAMVAFFLGGCVTTEVCELSNCYNVTPEVLELHGGKIALEVEGEIPPKKFHKKDMVEFMEKG